VSNPSGQHSDALLAYVLRLGDNALILGQRMIEFVAAYPELEEELANANFSLDYIGQARMFYTYAAELEGKGRTEDDLAFLRDSNEFRNLLLLEQPNGHFGDAIVRQIVFEWFYVRQLEALEVCSDPRLAEIAARAVKEIRYHLRYCSQWLVRLGDGTEESHDKAQGSLDKLWCFTGEMFVADNIDKAIAKSCGGPDLSAIQQQWQNDVASVVEEATLSLPMNDKMCGGGKQGEHTEHLDSLLAEMQVLQRTYEGATW
jgi:ring-1,2-phenylacetyl-CoA epoxidase subunit PaaC